MSTIMLLAIVMPMVGAFIGLGVALFRFGRSLGRSFGSMEQSVKDIKDRVERIETKIDNNAKLRQSGT